MKREEKTGKKEKNCSVNRKSFHVDASANPVSTSHSFLSIAIHIDRTSHVRNKLLRILRGKWHILRKSLTQTQTHKHTHTHTLSLSLSLSLSLCPCLSLSPSLKCSYFISHSLIHSCLMHSHHLIAKYILITHPT